MGINGSCIAIKNEDSTTSILVDLPLNVEKD